MLKQDYYVELFPREAGRLVVWIHRGLFNFKQGGFRSPVGGSLDSSSRNVSLCYCAW
jgi:hypothetical protein